MLCTARECVVHCVGVCCSLRGFDDFARVRFRLYHSSGSKAGSYARLVDFFYHSTLGLRVIKKHNKTKNQGVWCSLVNERVVCTARECVLHYLGVCCSLHGCVLFTARVGGVHRTGVRVSLFGSVLFTARVRFVHDVGVRYALRLRDVPIGAVLNLGTTSSQKCEAVPRRARIQGSLTRVSLNSRLDRNKEEEEVCTPKGRRCFPRPLPRAHVTHSKLTLNFTP